GRSGSDCAFIGVWLIKSPARCRRQAARAAPERPFRSYVRTCGMPGTFQGYADFDSYDPDVTPGLAGDPLAGDHRSKGSGRWYGRAGTAGKNPAYLLPATFGLSPYR